MASIAVAQVGIHGTGGNPFCCLHPLARRLRVDSMGNREVRDRYASVRAIRDRVGLELGAVDLFAAPFALPYTGPSLVSICPPRLSRRDAPNTAIAIQDGLIGRFRPVAESATGRSRDKSANVTKQGE